MKRTPLQTHIAEWRNCQRCRLANTRTNVVIGRGSLPCDVLFIGEAPGDSEDVLGQPFQGPAGQLFDRIIERSVFDRTYAITNLVGCIPRTDDGLKSGEPEYDEIVACIPRVEDIARIAAPKLVVTVGKLAKEWTEQGTKDSIELPTANIVSVMHPSAIIRAPYAQRGLLIQRSVVTIAKAVEKLIQQS